MMTILLNFNRKTRSNGVKAGVRDKFSLHHLLPLRCGARFFILSPSELRFIVSHAHPCGVQA